MAIGIRLRKASSHTEELCSVSLNRLLGLFAEREDVVKTEEVHRQNSRKFVLWVVVILIAILVLSSIIYDLKKSENWESHITQNSGLVHNYVNTIAID